MVARVWPCRAPTKNSVPRTPSNYAREEQKVATKTSKQLKGPNGRPDLKRRRNADKAVDLQATTKKQHKSITSVPADSIPLTAERRSAALNAFTTTDTPMTAQEVLDFQAIQVEKYQNKEPPTIATINAARDWATKAHTSPFCTPAFDEYRYLSRIGSNQGAASHAVKMKQGTLKKIGQDVNGDDSDVEVSTKWGKYEMSASDALFVSFRHTATINKAMGKPVSTHS
ncbi:hypothetical protein ACET3X_007265 [Alternaria dauci]|uniref:Uncharacterized protein n=1 Tax=Alternaria dauci TaxID=48095 RepID=A0ABR3UDE2_9PLEO